MIGVDVVEIARLKATLARSPKLAARLFTPSELDHARARRDPVLHLAGTLAAKEAIIKALRLSSLPGWVRRIEVTRLEDGRPVATITAPAETRSVSVSISHDGGVATAVAAEEPDGGRRDGYPGPAAHDRIPALVCTSLLADHLAEVEERRALIE